MHSPQVLIVGAGPAGLVAALSLLKNGIPVRIIEKDAEHHQDFRGSGVMPRTQEIEYFLGALDDVKKHAFETPTRHKYDPADPHKIVGTMKMVQEVAPTPAFPLTEPFSLAQYQHQAALRHHVERLGAQVELGTRATAIEQNESSVTVDIVKTTDGAEVKEKSKFAYVIGADGGHSTVRKVLGLKFLGETRDSDEERRYIADVRIRGFTLRGMHVWNVRGGNGAILRYAGDPGRYQIMLGGPSIDYAKLSANKDIPTLQNEFNIVTKRDDIEILEVIRQSDYRANIRMAEQFRVGRVFIAGDAAHSHSPSGGQGLNTSIADAFNLSWKLALVLKGHAPPSLLDSYEIERMPIVSEMLEISTSLHNKMIQQLVQQVHAKAHADAAEAAKSDNVYYRDWRLFQLDLNYRHSPFVLDDRYAHIAGEKADAYGAEGHDIRAGERAPDAPGLVPLAGATDEKPLRLFELFDPAVHTVLILSSSSTETSSLAQSMLDVLGRLPSGLVRTAIIIPGDATDAYAAYPSVDFVLKDSEGYTFKNYGLGGGDSAIIIVRPDSYIGAFVKDASSAEKYISVVFGSTS